MEKVMDGVFSGTGYECLKKCVENGWKGTIFLTNGEQCKFSQEHEFYSRRRLSGISCCDWLFAPCSYFLSDKAQKGREGL